MEKNPEKAERIKLVSLYLITGAAVLALFVWLVAENIEEGTFAEIDRTHILQTVFFLGGIGLWRYLWWMTHLCRAWYYGKCFFPSYRKAAEEIWQGGWRPCKLHLLVTTYRERPEVTERYLDAVLHELESSLLFATLWIACGSEEDEYVLKQWKEGQPSDRLDIRILRPVVTGKRAALGTVLRALATTQPSRDEIVLLMDGDSILTPGSLQRTLSCFGADNELVALTTNEQAELVVGPKWLKEWYAMRFAQRRLWMQSHALSGRVLTLTGRMSAYRADAVTDQEFSRIVEEDALSHWLWGKFRFVSGDDKSTWYCLLKRQVKMLYLPDAMVLTLEHVEGNAVKRLYENLLRWSGNMLRNGARAIDLGPKRMPFFIWWCLVDQRIAIWTVLAGVIATLSFTVLVDARFLLLFVAWIVVTRIIISIPLFLFAGRVHVSFPLLLYVTQLSSSLIKVYILFRLPLQRWSNRHTDIVASPLAEQPWRRVMAGYLTLFYSLLILLGVWLSTGILKF